MTPKQLTEITVCLTEARILQGEAKWLLSQALAALHDADYPRYRYLWDRQRQLHTEATSLIESARCSSPARGIAEGGKVRSLYATPSAAATPCQPVSRSPS
jgi:hypothetical protein